MSIKNTSEHYKQVVEFMEKAGQEVPTAPTEPSVEIRKLRARLILEEALETIRALGLSPYITICDWDGEDDYNREIELEEFSSFDFNDDKPFDLKEVIDGCCDIKVVTTGTLIACGIPDEAAQRLVDESNLRKFGPGGYRRDDGKFIKPPDWIPPDWNNFIVKLNETHNE